MGGHRSTVSQVIGISELDSPSWPFDGSEAPLRVPLPHPSLVDLRFSCAGVRFSLCRHSRGPLP
jgi:hypothetical protein